MIVHDDGEREDLELGELKSCVLPLNKPFHWPAPEDSRSNVLSRSVDLDMQRPNTDENDSSLPVQSQLVVLSAAASAVDDAATNGAHSTVHTPTYTRTSQPVSTMVSQSNQMQMTVTSPPKVHTVRSSADLRQTSVCLV